MVIDLLHVLSATCCISFNIFEVSLERHQLEAGNQK